MLDLKSGIVSRPETRPDHAGARFLNPSCRRKHLRRLRAGTRPQPTTRGAMQRRHPVLRSARHRPGGADPSALTNPAAPRRWVGVMSEI